MPQNRYPELIEALKGYLSHSQTELTLVFPQISQVLASPREGLVDILQLLYWMLEAEKISPENLKAHGGELRERLGYTLLGNAQHYPSIAYWLGRLICKAALEGKEFSGVFRTLLKGSNPTRCSEKEASSLIWGVSLAGLYQELMDSRLVKTQGMLVPLVGIQDLLPQYLPTMDAHHTQQIIFEGLKQKFPDLALTLEALVNGFYVDILLRVSDILFVIEIDGPFHLDPLIRLKDALRDAALAAVGVKVFRFSCLNVSWEVLFDQVQVKVQELIEKVNVQQRALVFVPALEMPEVIVPPVRERKVSGYLKAIFDFVENPGSAETLVVFLIAALPEEPNFPGLFKILSNEELHDYFLTQVLNHPDFVRAFQNNHDAAQALFQQNGLLGDVLSLLLISWEGRRFVLSLLPWLVEHRFSDLLAHPLWIQAVVENTPGFIEKLGESPFFRTMNWELFKPFLSAQNAQAWAREENFQRFFLTLSNEQLAELTDSSEGAILLIALQNSTDNKELKKKIESTFFAFNQSLFQHPKGNDQVAQSSPPSRFMFMTKNQFFNPEGMNLAVLSVVPCQERDNPCSRPLSFFSVVAQEIEVVGPTQAVLLLSEGGLLSIQSNASLAKLMFCKDLRDPLWRQRWVSMLPVSELPGELQERLQARKLLDFEVLKEFESEILSVACLYPFRYPREQEFPNNICAIPEVNSGLSSPLQQLENTQARNKVALLEAISKNPGFAEILEQDENFSQQWLSILTTWFLVEVSVKAGKALKKFRGLPQLLVNYKDSVFPWNALACSAFAQALVKHPSFYPALTGRFENKTALESLLTRDEGQLFFLEHVWPQCSDELVEDPEMMSCLEKRMLALAKHPNSLEFLKGIFILPVLSSRMQQEVFDCLADRIVFVFSEHDFTVQTFEILALMLNGGDQATTLKFLKYRLEKDRQEHPNSLIFSLARDPKLHSVVLPELFKWVSFNGGTELITQLLEEEKLSEKEPSLLSVMFEKGKAFKNMGDSRKKLIEHIYKIFKKRPDLCEGLKSLSLINALLLVDQSLTKTHVDSVLKMKEKLQKAQALPESLRFGVGQDSPQATTPQTKAAAQSLISQPPVGLMRRVGEKPSIPDVSIVSKPEEKASAHLGTTAQVFSLVSRNAPETNSELSASFDLTRLVTLKTLTPAEVNWLIQGLENKDTEEHFLLIIMGIFFKEKDEAEIFNVYYRQQSRLFGALLHRETLENGLVLRGGLLWSLETKKPQGLVEDPEEYVRSSASPKDLAHLLGEISRLLSADLTSRLLKKFGEKQNALVVNICSKVAINRPDPQDFLHRLLTEIFYHELASIPKNPNEIFSTASSCAWFSLTLPHDELFGPSALQALREVLSNKSFDSKKFQKVLDKEPGERTRWELSHVKVSSRYRRREFPQFSPEQ